MLLDVSVPLLSMFSLPLFVGAPLSTNLPIPSLGSLLGASLNFQALFWMARFRLPTSTTSPTASK